MLPGIPPTHRHVVVVGFREGKLAHERIYWHQASVLKQFGLLTGVIAPGIWSGDRAEAPRPSHALT
jgi:carboxymethylenebutenolidase